MKAIAGSRKQDKAVRGLGEFVAVGADTAEAFESGVGVFDSIAMFRARGAAAVGEAALFCAMWGLRALVFACLSTVVLADGAQRITEKEALTRIDAAARKANELEAYVTVSQQIRDNDYVTVRRYVRNSGGRPASTRTELIVESGDRSTETVYITRAGLSHMIYGKIATPIPVTPRLSREIPRRLTTGRALRSTEPLKYTIDRNYIYYGMPAERITVSLGPEMIRRLEGNPEILRLWADKLIPREEGSGEGSVNSGADGQRGDAFTSPRARGRSARASIALTEAMFPVAFVYVICRDVPFILSWQAYSFRGRKLYDVSVQKFSAVRELPDSLFAAVADRDAQDLEKKAQVADREKPNRMPFRFRGQKRLEMFFGSPNRCAVVLGMVALIVAAWLPRHSAAEGGGGSSGGGTVMTLARSRPDDMGSVGAPNATGARIPRAGASFRGPNMVRGLLALLLVALFVAIALTYSRGGYIATAAGLLLLGQLAHRRRLAYVSLLVFCVCLLAVPNGVERVQSITSVESDASITNRLALWKGTLAMIADNAWGGVGSDGFRSVYTTWYQPWELRHVTYGSAVNDYLSIAAFRGLGMLWLWIFIITGIVYAGIFVARGQRGGLSTLAQGLVAATACYLVAAFWSTFIIQWWVLGMLLAVLLSLAIAIVVACGRGDSIPWRRLLAGTGITATLCVGLLAVGGAIVARTYDLVPRTREWHGLLGGQGDAVVPRNADPRGTIIVLCETWHAEVEAREILRPLAAFGYSAIAFRPRDFDRAGAKQCTALLDRIARRQYPKPYIVVAQGGAARAAWIACKEARQVAGIVAVGSQPWPPDDALSAANLDIAKVPVLLVHGEYDKIVEARESRRLHEVLERAGVPSSLFVLSNADHRLTGRWPEVVQTMSTYFSPTPGNSGSGSSTAPAAPTTL